MLLLDASGQRVRVVEVIFFVRTWTLGYADPPPLGWGGVCWLCVRRLGAILHNDGVLRREPLPLGSGDDLGDHDVLVLEVLRRLHAPGVLTEVSRLTAERA